MSFRALLLVALTVSPHLSTVASSSDGGLFRREQAELQQKAEGGGSGSTSLLRPCLGYRNFQLTFEGGECTYDGILNAIEPKISKIRWCRHTAEDELWILLDVHSREEATDIIDGICVDAVERSRVNKNRVDFGFVTQMDDTFNKELFDGRTYWNEGGGRLQKNRPPPTPPTFRGNAKRVDAIDRNIAEKRVIAWPDHLPNFQSCDLNSAMCCWADGGLDPFAGGMSGSSSSNNNTDVCLVDLSNSWTSNHVSGGFTIFEGDEEGDVYCRGIAWENSPASWNNWFKGNGLFHMSLVEMKDRGRTRNVPGSPMCGCLEQMPVVSRADCTEIKVNAKFKIRYVSRNKSLTVDLIKYKIDIDDCQGTDAAGMMKTNDLSAFYETLWREGKVDWHQKEEFDRVVVGDHMCPKAIDDFLHKDVFYCSEDMKECPDGIFLMRDPHLFCHFPECPNEWPSHHCDEESMMCPDGTFVHPNPKTCDFPTCPSSHDENECGEDEIWCPNGTVLKRDVGMDCAFPSCPPIAEAPCKRDEIHCPDGTVLRRSDPNCTFPTCPVGGPPSTGRCREDKLLCANGATILERDPERNCTFPKCPDVPRDKVCLKDVKHCHDGNTVLMRDPERDCAFPPCPSVLINTTESHCPTDEKHCPDGIVLHRDPAWDCNFPSCPGNVSRCPTDMKHCPNGVVLHRDPAWDCNFPACPLPHFHQNEPPAHVRGGHECPDEKRSCPDGTIVTRDPGNSCDFFDCPHV